ncbi:methyltransferase [Neolentinus lepideus HHB14362 ss-1]|uniref:tRNA N(3)-methylcytidine methyltransferase n=1 Tax=Neolentinus lepideus HHB14362 ss-1 TaxID=1314782 RepID=A0A165SM21_9AGAM|nr:methyltransferase [Neolentinus lepideus HHB14362 ss-1]
MSDTSAPKPKVTSSVHDVKSEKPPWGSRFLIDEADVFSHNAWDHVPPPEDQTEKIAASLARQHSAPVPDEDKYKYNDRPARHWDNFYKSNESNFFKNRKWLHTEFPELVEATKPEAGPVTIVEIGCGAGNAVFPLLTSNQNPQLSLRAHDYSSHAVKLVQHNPLYLDPPVGSITASKWDLTSEDLPEGTEPGSVDIAILVFVLSALHPEEWGRAVANIHKMLKPGGLLLLRDYGRYDLAQLRFRSNRLLEENLYIRGDKTRVYFFEIDELALMFTGSRASSENTMETTKVEEDSEAPSKDVSTIDLTATPSSPAGDDVNTLGSPDGPTDAASVPTLTSAPTTWADMSPPVIHPSLLSSPLQLPHCPPHPLFSAEQLGVDRRLLVNRKRQLKMYRIWMQGKFKKL